MLETLACLKSIHQCKDKVDFHKKNICRCVNDVFKHILHNQLGLQTTAWIFHLKEYFFFTSGIVQDDNDDFVSMTILVLIMNWGFFGRI